MKIDWAKDWKATARYLYRRRNVALELGERTYKMYVKAKNERDEARGISAELRVALETEQDDAACAAFFDVPGAAFKLERINRDLAASEKAKSWVSQQVHRKTQLEAAVLRKALIDVCGPNYCGSCNRKLGPEDHKSDCWGMNALRSTNAGSNWWSDDEHEAEISRLHAAHMVEKLELQEENEKLKAKLKERDENG